MKSIALFLMCTQFLVAQKKHFHAIEYNLSFLQKHSPRMNFDPEGLSHGIEYRFFKQSSGCKHWENYYNAPRIGFLAKFLYLGNPNQILGHAFSVYPFLEMDFGKRFHLLLSDGIAYFDSPFHIKKNPKQNAIGSHWNRSICIKGQWRIYRNRYFDFFSGIGFTHYSNGAYDSPNLGLNYPSLDFHLRQKSVELNPFVKNKNAARIYSKWSTSLRTGLALKELKTTGGPKFFVYTLSVDAGYHYSDYKAIQFGAESEYHAVSPYFYEHTSAVEKVNPFQLALRYQLFVAHEWLLGKTSVSLSAGYRLNKDILLGGYSFYNKLNVSYHLPRLFRVVEPIVGISLKANFGVADHMALYFGLRWHKLKSSSN